MEIFSKSKVIRLRSHHDKYLLADEDQDTVSQDRNGTCNNARWSVEIVESSDAIRLKSCFGKYLTASNQPMLLGMTGKKVLQSMPKRLDSSVEWEPIREGVQVRLKTRYGQYLRANGGVPPWRNSVTHDIPHRSATQDWILWDVDIIEIRIKTQPTSPPAQPVLPPPPPPFEIPPEEPAECDDSPTYCLRSPPHKISKTDQGCDTLGRRRSGIGEGRKIQYEVADENGEVDETIGKRSFQFKGSSVEELQESMKEESGLEDICVCSRNPLNGKLHPLRLQLPPNHVALHLILVPSSSPLINILNESLNLINPDLEHHPTLKEIWPSLGEVLKQKD